MGLEYIQATILASDQEWNKNFIQLRSLFVEQNKFICCHVWILKKDFLHLFVICYPLHVHLKYVFRNLGNAHMPEKYFYESQGHNFILK